MAMHESGEDYLETILILHNKTGFVRSIDIATELGYSKPSVSRAVSILKSGGFIEVAADGGISLTDIGLEKANQVYERHIFIREFFSDVLGVDSEIAERDACKVEHVLSEETYLKFRSFIEKQQSVK